ncbi:MAG: cadherin-like domain-containing protein, partial [Bacteroidota bacterium]|nr:cadherin-like domain-containing protein [Bacteroidota bacterium]
MIINSSFGQGCSDWSPLSCTDIHKNLPINLTWSASHEGVNDGSGVGTGFTVVAPPTSRRTNLDGEPSNASLPGYEPSKLAVNTATGTLNMSTNRGIFFKSSADGGNSQINSLAVGIDARSNPLKIATKLLNLPAPVTQEYQQAGIWFGLGEADYVKLVVISHIFGNENIYEVQLVYELNDQYLAAQSEQTVRDVVASGKDILLQMIVDPDNSKVQGFYSKDNGTTFRSVGPAVTVPESFFNGITVGNATTSSSFAGLFVTQRNSSKALTYSFDNFSVEEIVGGIVNKPPTLDSISNPAAISMNTSDVQTINLTGISAGEGEFQSLTVEAVSSNPDLIPNPTVTYSSPNSTGTLTYTPVAGRSGTAEITVTVQDDGPNQPPSENAVSRTFIVTVSGTDNNAPTLDPIESPAPISEDSPAQTVNLTGISAGEGETQTLTVTAVSNNPELIPNPTITYTSPNNTGTLTFTPVANAYGTALITVTVTDNGPATGDNVNTFSQSFSVVVNPVNDAPLINEISNQNTAIGAPLGPVTFTIGDVDNDVNDLTVTAASSNQTLVPNANIVLAGTGANRTFTITPAAGQEGSATITLTVSDGELTGERAFTLSVGDAVTSIRNEVNNQAMLFYPN